MPRLMKEVTVAVRTKAVIVPRMKNRPLEVAVEAALVVVDVPLGGGEEQGRSDDRKDDAERARLQRGFE